MTTITLVKLPDGTIGGFSDRDKCAYAKYQQRLSDMEVGEILTIDAKLMRNGKFHCKFFKMLEVGYEAWEPERKHKTYKGMPVLKNEDQFREDVTIMAGFYEQTFNMRGEMKTRAKSISFASMEQPEFERVYSAVATVLLENVLTNYAGRQELDSVVNKLIGFL